MAQNAYKPTLCLNICGKDRLCPAIRAINRKSPIAFAFTFDSESGDEMKGYVESYIVDRIVNHFENLTYSTSDQTFYRYSDGVYLPITDEDLKAALESFLPYYLPKHMITNQKLNSLIERLKTQEKIRYAGRWNDHTCQVNLLNGIFNLRTRALVPHTPEFRSTIQLPFAYDARATAPVFDSFILDIFETNQGTVDYILKHWCYLFIPSYSFQKIMVWVGSGRNGKGTLARIQSALIGPANVATEDVHSLVHQRFSAINLKGKLVNYSSELKTDDLDLDMLKKLSGGDRISADVKFKEAVQFENTARLVIMANELPRFSELGNAILERFEFVKFPKQYNGRAADTRLDEKLLAEMPGIFNRVVAMYPQIIQPDGRIYFAAPAQIAKTKKTSLTSLSNVVAFVEDECQRTRDSAMPLKDLYADYSDWCKKSGYRSLGKKAFANSLRQNCGLTVQASRKADNKTMVSGLSCSWTRYYS